MREIKRLANNFRNAIDTAFEKGELRKDPLFSRFPNECCDLTCDLLGQYLLENGIETHQINGVYRHDRSWHHVWLITNNNVIIDITEDQFLGKISSVKTFRNVHVGAEGEVQKQFDQNRRYEENTNFVDPNEFLGFAGQPNVRQRTLIELYRIICQYL